MDILPIFKSYVNTLKGEKTQVINNIIIKTRPRDEFAKQAKDVCNKITTLRNFLLENRAAYMKFGMHLKVSAQMTDSQRDLIDRQSEKFISYYTAHLLELRNEWKKIKKKRQESQHIEAVLDLLTEYLKEVYNIYIEQKEYRIQHEHDTYQFIKLASDKNKIPIRLGSARKQKDQPQFEKRRIIYNGGELCNKSGSGKVNVIKRKSLNRKGDSIVEPNNYTEVSAPKEDILDTHQSKVATEEDEEKLQQLIDDELKGLSPEDIQVFEQENAHLYQELQALYEEVELIEKNVVDIAQLQDVFTEKVSLQKHSIERITNAVIGATENVKDANNQIQKAIQRNAGLRVWSLFFLLVMSIALLFLDWYYD